MRIYCTTIPVERHLCSWCDGAVVGSLIEVKLSSSFFIVLACLGSIKLEIIIIR